jgi:HAD superfamily hydrolase (TIGR01549 family)
MSKKSTNFSLFVLVFTTGFSFITFFNAFANPADTVIAFDMHKVFMEQNFLSLGWSLVKKYPGTALKTLVNPVAWHRIAKLKTKKVGETVMRKLDKKLLEEFQKLSLKEAFMMETVKIIQELKAAGYRLYVLSNCEETTYKKLQEAHPTIFSLFNGAYLPSATNKYNHKPNHSFYKEFQTYLNQQGLGGKKILFIDDRKENINAANTVAAGFTGIQFVSAKKLRKDLDTMKILSFNQPALIKA